MVRIPRRLIRFVSWNVNSLRSAEEKFLKFIDNQQPDVVMLQELRAEPNQLSLFLQNIPGYGTLFNPSGRPGYGGTALYYRENLPITNLTTATGKQLLDQEGRTVQLCLNKTVVLNFYVPNGNRNGDRLNYKLNFYKAMIEYFKTLLAKNQAVIIGADMNVAHAEIDLYSPKTNTKNSGFLPIERELFDQLLNLGLVDVFRHFNKGSRHYTWWSLRDPTRAQNHGWRYDYFLVSKNLLGKVKKSTILKEVFGSDHCPILLEVKI